MRYCQVSFAAEKPTWGLPPGGPVAALVAAQASSVGPADVQAAGVGAPSGVSRAFRAGGDWKRLRLTKKTPVFRISHLGHQGQPIPRLWKRLHSQGREGGERGVLGTLMPRGGVLHRVWENVMGLAELFGTRLHGPTPQGRRI